MTNRMRAAMWLAAALLIGGAARDGARAESDWLQSAFPEKSVEQPARRAKRPLTRSQEPRARAEARLRVPLRSKPDAEGQRSAVAAPARGAGRAEGSGEGNARAGAEASREATFATDGASVRMGLGVKEPVSIPAATGSTTAVNAPGEVRLPRPMEAPAVTVPSGPASLPKDEVVKSQEPKPANPIADAPKLAEPEPATTTARAAVMAPGKDAEIAVLTPPASPSLVTPAHKAPAAATPLSPPPRPLQPGETGGNAIVATASDARAAAVERGKQLWQVRRGPRGAALEECDLGLGRGRVVGTFAHLPRYFSDVNRVMDLETRILWCAQTLQSVTARDLARQRPVDEGTTSELDDLVAYVASLSISWRLSAPMEHLKEKQAVEVGRALFGRRQGPFDFACATCHGSADEPAGASQTVASGSRRAMTDWRGVGIPRLDRPEEARTVLAAIPFRGATAAETRTIQARIARCFGYAGIEAPEPGSDVIVTLVSYLAKLGEHGEITATRRKP